VILSCHTLQYPCSPFVMKMLEDSEVLEVPGILFVLQLNDVDT